MSLSKLRHVYISETCSRVRVGKQLTDMFPVKNGLEKGDALSKLLFSFAIEYEEGSGKPG